MINGKKCKGEKNMKNNVVEFEDEIYIYGYTEPQEIIEKEKSLENYSDSLREISELFPYITDDSMCNYRDDQNLFAIDNFLVYIEVSKEITIYPYRNLIDDAFIQDKFINFRYDLVFDIIDDDFDYDEIGISYKYYKCHDIHDFKTYKKLVIHNLVEYIISKKDIHDRFSLLILLANNLNLRVNYNLFDDGSQYRKPLNYNRWR